MSSPRAVERILSRLEGVQRYNGYFMARCPSHDDGEPSLSISEGDDGRALVRCHAGCKFEEIMAAGGLTAKDAFPWSAPHDSRRKKAVTLPKNGRYVDTLGGVHPS